MANYKRAAAQSEAAQQEVNRLQEKLAKLKALDILRQGTLQKIFMSCYNILFISIS